MRGVRLVLLGLIFFSAFHLTVYAQPRDTRGWDSAGTLGPFLVEGEWFTVTLRRRAFSAAELALESSCGKHSVVSVEIRNGSGTAQTASSFGFTPPSNANCESMEVSATVLKGSRHSGLLVLYNRTSTPEGVTPYTDALFQLYGVIGGQLKAFNNPILVNYLWDPNDVSDFGALRVDPLDATSDVWTLPVWARHFNVLYPIRLNWGAGKLEPLNECSRQSLRALCEYSVEPVNSLEAWPDLTGIVHLCASRANPCLNGKPMNVAQERRIKMISAFANVLWPDTHNGGDETLLGIPYDEDEDQVWLKLQVNGSEGWIHEAKDYNELGFPREQ